MNNSKYWMLKVPLCLTPKVETIEAKISRAYYKKRKSFSK